MWNHVKTNAFPEIILSDCCVKKICLGDDTISFDLSDEGFLIERNQIYYHTGAAQVTFDGFNVEESIVKIIMNYKMLRRKNIEIIHEIELENLMININSGKWKFTIVEEFYSPLGGFLIGRLYYKQKKMWCYLNLRFHNIRYFWNEINYNMWVM